MNDHVGKIHHPAAIGADIAALAEAGVDLDEITADLERAGVQQFADAYAQMLEAITRKRQRIAVS